MAQSLKSTSGSLPSSLSSWRAVGSLAEDVLLKARAGRDIRLGDLHAISNSAPAMAVDGSRLVMTNDALGRLFDLGRERGLEARRDAMLRGDIVNRSEQR